jgi:uncharacterized membrane protein
MWLNPQLFPDVPEVFLSVRLVIQLLLLALIWWSTRAISATAVNEFTERAQHD